MKFSKDCNKRKDCSDFVINAPFLGKACKKFTFKGYLNTIPTISQAMKINFFLFQEFKIAWGLIHRTLPERLQNNLRGIIVISKSFIGI